MNEKISSISIKSKTKSSIEIGGNTGAENKTGSGAHQPDFFGYWDSLGYFENIKMFLPRKFFLLFEIARLIATKEKDSSARNAIEELLDKGVQQTYDREKSIQINRLEKNAPLGEKMEIQYFKTIYDLRKTLPRELAWSKQIFNMKLFTKTLLVQKYFESEEDNFKPISQLQDDSGRERNKFEQKFYLLLDRSRSMDNRMRSFYSKSIVVEFLRRKLDSNAKLYFRAFDSKPGSLVKVEKKEDFSALIEKVILTTTGGTSTNMQEAVFQAIRDIAFDKDMMDAEILVVTDGLVHDLDIMKMKSELKDIKLNFLKIGLDLAEPDGYEIKRVLSEAGLDFDPFSVSIKEIKNKLHAAKLMSPVEQRIYEYMLDCSDKIVNDLKEISHKYIEIEDIKQDALAAVKKDIIESLETALPQLLNIDINNKTIDELAVIYKKVYFLSQYLQYLTESGDPKDSALRKAAKELDSLKEKLLGNPLLFEMIEQTGGFTDDKKAIKAMKKDAKKKLKTMAMQAKTLSKDDIKNAEMIFSMGGGGGSGDMGGFLYVLFIKLIEAVKSLFNK